MQDCDCIQSTGDGHSVSSWYLNSNVIEEDLHITQPLTAEQPAEHEAYDVAVVGGGLAGLAVSIQLVKHGHRVITFEKEEYPFHKVCGEYISLESWDFLNSLGLELEKMNLPVIKRLQLSAANGKTLQQKLPLGGFGVSRYLLDFSLAEIAKSLGVIIEENRKVTDISFAHNKSIVHTNQQSYIVKVACGSFGKRSNIDSKWKRLFTTAPKNKLNNYVGVKYHIKTKFPPDTIALHVFDGGYCGLVKIEEDKYNLCYLTTAVNLQQHGGNIKRMEDAVLNRNPHIREIFTNSEFLLESPLTISQISFDKKEQVENHVLMLGDAAGMITPLCGNGMSMALHSSKLAARQINRFLQGQIPRMEMEQQYALQWQQQFSKRLKAGRMIQSLFTHKWLTNRFIGLVNQFPFVANRLIRLTHGRPF